jgi:hypothetical protein
MNFLWTVAMPVIIVVDKFSAERFERAGLIRAIKNRPSSQIARAFDRPAS